MSRRSSVHGAQMADLDGLSCALCFERYNNNEQLPICLDCGGHTFCKGCLIRGNIVVACPTCRATMTKPVSHAAAPQLWRVGRPAARSTACPARLERRYRAAAARSSGSSGPNGRFGQRPFRAAALEHGQGAQHCDQRCGGDGEHAPHGRGLCLAWSVHRCSSSSEMWSRVTWKLKGLLLPV